MRSPWRQAAGGLLYDDLKFFRTGGFLVDIHKFEVNGEYILLDVNSGAVHVLDAAT